MRRAVLIALGAYLANLAGQYALMVNLTNRKAGIRLAPSTAQEAT